MTKRLILRVAMGIIAGSWPVAAQDFSPSLQDTAVISFDPVEKHLTTEFVSFQCLRTGGTLLAANWRIDDKLPDPNIYIMTISPCCAELRVRRSAAETNHATGIHKLSLTARFEESTISATWHFKFHVTRYNQVHAKILVDSLWTGTGQFSKKYCIKYKLLHAAPFDTSVFGNADRSCGGLVKSDTANIQKEYIECKPYPFPYSQGQPLNAAIVQIDESDPRRGEWKINASFDSLLQSQNGSCASAPFPIQRALRHFNEYLSANNLTKGYFPPLGAMRLGPVFNFDMGDPGWKVKAYHDDAFWRIVHMVGSGDCECGCTHWDTTVYTISEAGVVMNFPAAVRPPFNAAPRPALRNRMAATRYFTLTGQSLGPGRIPLRGSVYLSSNPGGGVYKKAPILRGK